MENMGPGEAVDFFHFAHSAQKCHTIGGSPPQQ